MMSKKQPPILPVGLENELSDYYGSPTPSPEFVTRLEHGLRFKLKEQENKKMFGKSVHLKWGLSFALLAMLIIFFAAAPTLVAAMMRLLGYIPGIGLVESESPVRVLAESVSQTRDGITVTVSNVVISSEETIVAYVVENIPPETLLRQDDARTCGLAADLRLPDGTLLQEMAKLGEGSDTGFAYRVTYKPVPADVDEAILVIQCIQDSLPGALPENWELPLRFIPAPPDMTMLPVLEPTASLPSLNDGPLVLEKVIETETGYILTGRFHSTELPGDATALGFATWPKITDAAGQDVSFTPPNDVNVSSEEMGVIAWAFEIEGKQHNWPLTLTFDLLSVEYSNARAEFEFDAGTAPYPGQVWDLNLDLEIAGYPLHVVSVARTEDGYDFTFENETGRGVSAEISGTFPNSGSSSSDGAGHMSSSIIYAGEVPSGKLTVILSHPVVELPGLWQLQWQPDTTPPEN